MFRRLMLGSVAGLAVFWAAASAGAIEKLEIVETRSQFVVVLIDTDFVRPDDPSGSVMGGTSQFVDNEIVLAELILIQPMARAQLRELKVAAASGQIRFHCQSVTLYRT